MCVCLAAPELQNTFCQLLKDKNYPHVFSTQINQTKDMNTLDRGTATSCIRNTFSLLSHEVTSWTSEDPYTRTHTRTHCCYRTIWLFGNGRQTKKSQVQYTHLEKSQALWNLTACSWCMENFELQKYFMSVLIIRYGMLSCIHEASHDLSHDC